MKKIMAEYLSCMETINQQIKAQQTPGKRNTKVNTTKHISLRSKWQISTWKDDY